ncbi:hypothetical protein STEG23_037034, partial [Scotinomys teguina]
MTSPNPLLFRLHPGKNMFSVILYPSEVFDVVEDYTYILYENKVLSVSNRAGLIDDAFSLA